MPYCWDGHDNARRAVETGTGKWLHRAHWTSEELAATMRSALEDTEMRDRLGANARGMILANGVNLAAERIIAVALLSEKHGFRLGRASHSLID